MISFGSVNAAAIKYARWQSSLAINKVDVFILLNFSDHSQLLYNINHVFISYGSVVSSLIVTERLSEALSGFVRFLNTRSFSLNMGSTSERLI